MGDHLFRRLLLLLLLFTFLVPSLAAASNPAGEPDNLLADADGPIDWVVVEYVFDRQYDRGGQVDTVKFEYGIEGTFIEDSSEEPRYFGFDLAWSGTHVFRGLSVLPLAPGPLHTTVVTPLGGHDVLLSSPAEQSRDARVSGWVEDGVGFSDRFLLVFVGSGSDLSRLLVAEPVVHSGTLVDVVTHLGSGTRAVRSIGPGATGVGQQTAGAGAGVVQREVEVGEAIYGAFPVSDCTNCVASWQDPNGRSGEYLAATVADYGTWQGEEWFAGPAGTWNFTWAGTTDPAGWASVLTTNDATLAVWAPLGEELVARLL